MIRSNDVSLMLKCINKIERLVFDMQNDWTSVPLSKVKTLLDVIHKREKSLKSLAFVQNRNNHSSFEDSQINKLFSCIPILHIDELYFLGTASSLPPPAFTVMTKAIKKLENPLWRLDLSGCAITYENLKLLASCLCNIEELGIATNSRSRFSVQAIEVLTDAVKCLPKPIHYLNLSGYFISDEGLFTFATCMHNINELVIGSILDNISVEGINILANSLKNLTTPMHKLTLLCGGFIGKALHTLLDRNVLNLHVISPLVSYETREGVFSCHVVENKSIIEQQFVSIRK